MTITKRRIFAGDRLRSLRKRGTLDQAAMAARLGISVSYLSQLENDDRPLTATILSAIGKAFPLERGQFELDVVTQRFAAVESAMGDPLFSEWAFAPDALARLAETQPLFAEAFVTLHSAYRHAEERLLSADDAMASGVPGADRLPWEEVRDWFHEAGNYIDPIDTAAEALSLPMGDGEADMIARLASLHGIHLIAAGDDTALRAYDRAGGTLAIDPALPPESRRFLLAHQLAAIELAAPIAAVADGADLQSDTARRLLSVGLANYAAGALLMPYARYRAAALDLRHDIDRLRRQFGVSFEQACHRLSTLQRPGARGIPFFFCRIDMAGNITKRHSATRLQFARFGGACPLWIVHEAVAIPDRILVQLAETPDGVRYVQMAKGLVKPSGSYARAPRRYAVALGCEIEHARDFIYADGLDVTSQTGATPIGISCRLCPRVDCDQRAFPPADRAILIDPDRRDVVPYQVI